MTPFYQGIEGVQQALDVVEVETRGWLVEDEERWRLLLLADEISPDTCRLWDAKTGEKMDKDRFRRDLGNVEEAYQEVLKLINTV